MQSHCPDLLRHQVFVPRLTRSFQKEAHTRINEARPENQDNSATSRQQTIKAELKQLREQQDDGKKQRLVIQDKIKALDTQFKSKLAEQKAGKAQIPYKSVEDIDKEIARLDAQVESAKLKLVDEKKALTDISALRKQRKVLSALDSQNGELTKIKASISEAKTQLDTPERRAQNAQYEAKSKELEAATSSQRDQYKVLNEARDALKEAKSSQDQEWQVLKAMQDDYYKQKRAHHEHEREAAKQREARKKSEREVYSRVKRQERLTQKLEEAALPAYGDEIRAADTLLRMLDSNAVPVKSISTPSELAAKAQRTVDDSAFKGTKLLKRTEDEETYFMGTGPKKGKKSKKTRTAADEPRDAPSETKDFGRFWNPSVLEQFAVLSMDPPSTQDQAIKTLDQVMEKKKFFLSDRGRKTKEVS